MSIWNEQPVAFAVLVLLLAILSTAAVRMRFGELERRIATISRIEAKVDLLLRHSGLSFDPYADLSQECAFQMIVITDSRRS
jgi:hypothetical protein